MADKVYEDAWSALKYWEAADKAAPERLAEYRQMLRSSRRRLWRSSRRSRTTRGGFQMNKSGK